ncbi:inositol monophosphatase 1 isoform X1 [Engraulis encrasicolus]|uniref:inositol monophosphatase 1 isoform X1 n=2 Tax=Engraulis encrasicolus TaxID=184585 RepID=UPI002FD40790
MYIFEIAILTRFETSQLHRASLCSCGHEISVGKIRSYCALNTFAVETVPVSFGDIVKISSVLRSYINEVIFILYVEDQHPAIMPDLWQEAMDHAVSLARKAGEIVREALQNEMKFVCKSSSVDLVTKTDQKVEQLIIASVKEKFPTHSFIGEESVAAGEPCILSDNPTWIVDPVDGTTNFVHGYPFVAISIGFAANKQLEFGVVYSCLEDKMYTARKGKGAFCNGQPLQVSDQTDINQSIIATEFGSNRDPEVVDKIFSNMRKVLTLPVHGMRGVGTAATNMCLVATGCVEAYYEIGIHCWDVAAAAVIVSEAGGVLMDLEGGPLDLMSRRVLAANNKTIAQRLVKEIETYPAERDDAPLDSKK